MTAGAALFLLSGRVERFKVVAAFVKRLLL
jgi:hypothetical protein